MDNILLDETQIDYFQRTGAICLRQVFSPEWVHKIAVGIDKNLQNPSSHSENLPNEGSEVGAGGGYFNDYCNWKDIPEFEDYIYHSPAASIVGQLLQSEYITFYHEHVLVKEIGSTRPTPWHVDQSYYPIDGFKVCSIWMPIDKIKQENTIQFIEGSHRWESWFMPRKFATSLNYPRIDSADNKLEEERVYNDVPTEDELIRGHNLLQWAVDPGDCIVFHMKTMHGAPGNKSKVDRRRIFSTRWLGDDAIIAARPWKVSPPIYGGLTIGEKAVSKDFPLLWKKIK